MASPDPIHLENGFRHLPLGDVGSTNAVCLEHARSGDTGGLWVTAQRQLAGRGSRGREWVSENGNLYASLLLREPGALPVLHTLTFVASLAIRDAIYASSGAEMTKVGLKWPNDVLLNGKKTSGILLESHDIGGIRYVIIGMGINVAHHPEVTLHLSTDLRAEGINSDPGLLFQHLNHAMEKRLLQWSRGDGFSTIRADWLSAASGMGQTIEIRLPGEQQPRTGIFGGIDENGLLLLEGAGGRQERVSVADIFFA